MFKSERLFTNGELPVVNNDDHVEISLFNPHGDKETIEATKDKYFIPGYRVSKDTVVKWAEKQGHWNSVDFETIIIIATAEDQGEYPRFGAAVYHKQKAGVTK